MSVRPTRSDMNSTPMHLRKESQYISGLKSGITSVEITNFDLNHSLTVKNNLIQLNKLVLLRLFLPSLY